MGALEIRSLRFTITIQFTLGAAGRGLRNNALVCPTVIRVLISTVIKSRPNTTQAYSSLDRWYRRWHLAQPSAMDLCASEMNYAYAIFALRRPLVTRWPTSSPYVDAEADLDLQLGGKLYNGVWDRAPNRVERQSRKSSWSWRYFLISETNFSTKLSL